MKSERIAKAWASYRSKALPHARSADLIECRRAFYAGAQAFFAEISNLPEGTEFAAIEVMRLELIAFEGSVEAGAA